MLLTPSWQVKGGNRSLTDRENPGVSRRQTPVRVHQFLAVKQTIDSTRTGTLQMPTGPIRSFYILVSFRAVGESRIGCVPLELRA